MGDAICARTTNPPIAAQTPVVFVWAPAGLAGAHGGRRPAPRAPRPRPKPAPRGLFGRRGAGGAHSVAFPPPPRREAPPRDPARLGRSIGPAAGRPGLGRRTDRPPPPQRPARPGRMSVPADFASSGPCRFSVSQVRRRRRLYLCRRGVGPEARHAPAGPGCRRRGTNSSLSGTDTPYPASDS